MWLTQRQRRALEFYRRFRHESLTGWSLFRATMALHILSFLLVIAALIFFSWGYDMVAVMIVSLLVGAQWRDSTYQASFLRIWPALQAVIDWDKLEQLLETQIGKDRPESDAG